jgi:hypothetical protein
MAEFLEPLKRASKDLQAAGMYFMQNGMKNPNNALAGSYRLHAPLRACLPRADVGAHGGTSLKALAEGTDDPVFHETKLATARFFMARVLPMTATHLARIQAGGDTVMALDAANF